MPSRPNPIFFSKVGPKVSTNNIPPGQSRTPDYWSLYSKEITSNVSLPLPALNGGLHEFIANVVVIPSTWNPMHPRSLPSQTVGL